MGKGHQPLPIPLTTADKSGPTPASSFQCFNDIETDASAAASLQPRSSTTSRPAVDLSPSPECPASMIHWWQSTASHRCTRRRTKSDSRSALPVSKNGASCPCVSTRHRIFAASVTRRPTRLLPLLSTLTDQLSRVLAACHGLDAASTTWRLARLLDRIGIDQLLLVCPGVILCPWVEIHLA